MGKLLFVEEVTETIVKFLLGVVGNPKQAVHDAEGVSKIVIKIVASDLDGPTFQVPSVKKLNPFLPILLICDGLAVGARRANQKDAEEKCQKSHWSHNAEEYSESA